MIYMEELLHSLSRSMGLVTAELNNIRIILIWDWRMTKGVCGMILKMHKKLLIFTHFRSFIV